MLREKLSATAQLKSYCDIIERNAKMQLQLIEDLLDTARIVSDTGKGIQPESCLTYSSASDRLMHQARGGTAALVWASR